MSATAAVMVHGMPSVHESVLHLPAAVVTGPL